MTERRAALRVPIAVCPDGHAADAGPPEPAVEIRCPACRCWTWEDRPYCGQCGKKRP